MTVHQREIVVGCFRAASRAGIAPSASLPGAVEPARTGIQRKPVRRVPRSSGTPAGAARRARGARLPVLLTHKRDLSRVLARKNSYERYRGRFSRRAC